MYPFRRVEDNKLVYRILPIASCPCGSNKAAYSCCLSVEGFCKKMATTTPPLPKTSYELNGCYAASLNDCSPRLSREHFVSESLLHELNTNSDLTIRGFRWLRGNQKKNVPPNALTSRMLCERHNTALSSLDSIACRVFEAFNEVGVAGSGQQQLFLFNGHDLERWLLKVLCGLMFSKSLLIEEDIDLSIPKQWLRVLYGYERFATGQGLYLPKGIGEQFAGPTGLMLRALAKEGRISGFVIWICGYELILSMTGFNDRLYSNREVVYRPIELYTTGPRYEKSVVFSWDMPADLGTISLQI